MCWNPTQDISYVGESIKEIYKILSITNTLKMPLYIFGISSGGTFAGNIAERFHDDLTLKISGMAIHLSHLKIYSKNNPPPTIFIPMIKDSTIYSKTKRNIAELHIRKVDSDLLPCEQQLIKIDYFNKHDDRISMVDSELIYNTLLKYEYITESGVLLKDPRVTDWSNKIQSMYIYICVYVCVYVCIYIYDICVFITVCVCIVCVTLTP